MKESDTKVASRRLDDKENYFPNQAIKFNYTETLTHSEKTIFSK